jgi:hypothetical protein
MNLFFSKLPERTVVVPEIRFTANGATPCNVPRSAEDTFLERYTPICRCIRETLNNVEKPT